MDDHHHGPRATISEEADSLYQPLAPWTPPPVDEAAWVDAHQRLQAVRDGDPDRADMVGRGAMLAAAYQSGALDGAHAGDSGVALALVRGEASLVSMDEAVRTHVGANLAAIELARDARVSETTIRQVHEVACRPQLTHRVLVEGRSQDHVMAPGDYKHHPNHLRLPGGAWRATVPVAQVHAEMDRLVSSATGAGFAALHPAQRAAWLHHALLHVQPFADGNGRVARALAGGDLLRAGSVPLVVFDDRQELDVVQAVTGLVDLMQAAGGAVDTWRRRSAAAEDLRRRAVHALERALRRPDPARRSDVSTASIGDDMSVRVPGVDVHEMLVVDAHPLDGGRVSVVAREAGVRLVDADDVDRWAERVATVLALRVAAEME